ncbi:nicotinamide/nicotinate riboside kinase [Spirosomataceae bacterium TFI 002]|nr:nicotinamide/nicotinate riboside kinase [Spirosomataceae bacterium TFI 002]
MLIGIGGVSRSGKSTLANLLVTYFRRNGKKAIIFHQDDFVFPETEIPKVKGKTDWESPKSIDDQLLLEVVRDFNERFEVVIVEGLFAFSYPALNELYDKRIFVKISKRTFLIRKVMDTRWGYVPTWFVDHIWKSFLKNGNETNIIGDYIRASGEDEFNMDKVLKYLNKANSVTLEDQTK